MLHTQPVDHADLKWPDSLCLKLETFQLEKIAAVAIASIAFFACQMGCSFPIVAGIAFLSSTVTLLSETFLRTNGKENIRWFNFDFDPWLMMVQVAARLLVLPIIVGIVTLSGIAPMQAVAYKIMAGNLKMILIATVVAPFAEEILFRGFIQERLEDVANLCDQYIYPLSDRVKQGFSMCLQSLFFGSIHITGTQVANLSHKIAVLCSTSFFAFLLTFLKNNDKSLVAPIAIHSAQNTGFSLGLLASRCFTQV